MARTSAGIVASGLAVLLLFVFEPTLAVCGGGGGGRGGHGKGSSSSGAVR